MKRATQIGTHMLSKTPVVWLDLVNPLSDQELSPGATRPLVGIAEGEGIAGNQRSNRVAHAILYLYI